MSSIVGTRKTEVGPFVVNVKPLFLQDASTLPNLDVGEISIEMLAHQLPASTNNGFGGPISNEPTSKTASNFLNSEPHGYKPPYRRIERWICKQIFRLMISSKCVHVDFDIDGHDADFVLAPPRLWPTLKVLLAPNMCIGETFVAGQWYLKKGALRDFLHVIKRDAHGLYGRYFTFVSRLRGARYYVGQHILNRYYTRKAKRHYEVDAKIYEMILDPEMAYTCAFFDAEHRSLAAAQMNKFATLIARMSLPTGSSRVLDIGCGWGALERAMVRAHPSVEVCGLSISNNQIAWAKEHNQSALSCEQRRRIEYRLEDYEAHQRAEYYDAVTAVGMIEHVGLGGYKKFFSAVHKFLKPGGVAVIHTIVCPSPMIPTNSWIDRHIFTGGYSPSVSEVLAVIERQQFRLAGVYIQPPEDYRKTIECWIDNLVMNLDHMREYLASVGISGPEIDRFVRMWLFYLSGVRNIFDASNPRSRQIAHLCIRKLEET